MTNIGMPIKRGKPLMFNVGDKITIINWSPNKKLTHLVAKAFPAKVTRVFTWVYMLKGVENKDTMYDVQFDGDTEPDPVAPRMSQPHMYGADWVNIIARPGTTLPKSVKIPEKEDKSDRDRDTSKRTPIHTGSKGGTGTHNA